jgi:hypothetical protein
MSARKLLQRKASFGGSFVAFCCCTEAPLCHCHGIFRFDFEPAGVIARPSFTEETRWIQEGLPMAAGEEKSVPVEMGTVSGATRETALLPALCCVGRYLWAGSECWDGGGPL